MRHLLANVATYVLALGLALGAALFAWARSEQLMLATAAEVEPQHYATAADPGAFDWPAFGAQVYRANCQNCHGARGTGRDLYPPVHAMEAHLAAPGGRAYLVDLVVYGLRTGLHAAPMPPMHELSDAQIAAVTNHVLTQFGRVGASDALYVPADVRARRGRDDRERDVGARRPRVPPPAALSAAVETGGG